MFTGIVEATGVVRALSAADGAARIVVEAGAFLDGARLGDSIAVNGVCVTITRTGGPLFEADLGAETLRRTTLGQLRAGAPVNLERPLAVGDRLGGHIVQGHVDGVRGWSNAARKARDGGWRSRSRRRWPATSWRRARSRWTA